MATSDCIIIPLTRGYSTIIDAIDSDLANLKWNSQSAKGKSYAVRYSSTKSKKSLIFLHRVILSRVLGREILPTEKVDHKDGNGLNNRRGNLRLATHAQNMRNRKIGKNNTTGYKGVTKRGDKFRAAIQVNGKTKKLGTYSTAIDAADAYDKAAIKHHGEFAATNTTLKTT